MKCKKHNREMRESLAPVGWGNMVRHICTECECEKKQIKKGKAGIKHINLQGMPATPLWPA
ncbi:MAG: hypothetical protein ABIG60_04155 [Patescibacteria group bacterium]